MNSIDRIVAAVTMALALFAAICIVMVGDQVGLGQPDGPVCHAPTEDSVILDCDYHDGGWWRK